MTACQQWLFMAPPAGGWNQGGAGWGGLPTASPNFFLDTFTGAFGTLLSDHPIDVAPLGIVWNSVGPEHSLDGAGSAVPASGTTALNFTTSGMGISNAAGTTLEFEFTLTDLAPFLGRLRLSLIGLADATPNLEIKVNVNADAEDSIGIDRLDETFTDSYSIPALILGSSHVIRATIANNDAWAVYLDGLLIASGLDAGISDTWDALYLQSITTNGTALSIQRVVMYEGVSPPTTPTGIMFLDRFNGTPVYSLNGRVPDIGPAWGVSPGTPWTSDTSGQVMISGASAENSAFIPITNELLGHYRLTTELSVLGLDDIHFAALRVPARNVVRLILQRNGALTLNVTVSVDDGAQSLPLVLSLDIFAGGLATFAVDVNRNTNLLTLYVNGLSVGTLALSAFSVETQNTDLELLMQHVDGSGSLAVVSDVRLETL